MRTKDYLGLGDAVHVALFEMFVLEVQMVAVPVHLVDLTEPVHIELSDERFDLVVPEEHRQHDLLQFLLVLYKDFVIGLAPADDLLVLIFLI